MAFDNNRIYRPDFEASQQLPQWVPMEGDSQQMGQQAGSFVDALKARMGAKQDLGGGSTYTPGGTGATRPRTINPKAMGGGEGGGMSSL